MSASPDPTGGIVPNTMPGNNAESNPAAVLQALQACNAFWKSPALATCSGYTACCIVGVKQYDGQLWALGERGYTLFNTIVPPNSKQYPWRSCRLSVGCLPQLRTGRVEFHQCQQLSSWRVQFRFRRRKRPVHQGFGQYADLPVARHTQWWRGDQFRQLLRARPADRLDGDEDLRPRREIPARPFCVGRMSSRSRKRRLAGSPDADPLGLRRSTDEEALLFAD